MNKKWIIVFFSVAVILIVALGVFNYLIDPFGYWEIQHGKVEYLSTYK